MSRPPQLPSVTAKSQQLTQRFSHGGADYIDFLPGTLAVTEQAPARWSNLAIWVSAAFFVFMLLWATFAEVERVAVGSGKVRPAGNVVVINHPFPGKVTELNVKNGDLVTAGQILLRLDPADVAQQVAQIRAQYNLARAEVARLQAEDRNAREPDFPDDLYESDGTLLATQLDLFRSRQRASQEQRNGLLSSAAQRQAEIDQLQSQVRGTATELNLASQQAAAARELAEKGYFPKLRVLSAERDVTSLQRNLDQAQSGIVTARGALQEARARLAQYENERKSEILKELSERKLQMSQAKSELERLLSQQGNLAITAPRAGIIEKLTIKSVGQAIVPTEAIMNLVPMEESYVLDVRINDRDISHIQLEQPATIKFTAYDYQRYGKLAGTVILKPADSILDEKTGQVFYNVVVKPAQPFLGHNASTYRLQSGMTAEVDLLIGKRTVLSYLSDVVFRTADEAFRE